VLFDRKPDWLPERLVLLDWLEKKKEPMFEVLLEHGAWTLGSTVLADDVWG
jgi:hypothetical protein